MGCAAGKGFVEIFAFLPASRWVPGGESEERRLMWASLSRPWQLCFEGAWEAYCAGSLPIGAAITDQEGVLLARGRNRVFDAEGIEGSQIYHSPLAHAEINALIAVDFEEVDPGKCILYTASEPCPLCIGAIAIAGIGEVRYASHDPYTGSVALLQASDYFRGKQIRVVGPEREDLEEVFVTLLIAYKLRIEDEDFKKFLLPWEKAFPTSYGVSGAIVEEGSALRMCADGLPAEKALQQLREAIERYKARHV
jgi:tRNA(Arg) A34 adenosine deaminase TadA